MGMGIGESAAKNHFLSDTNLPSLAAERRDAHLRPCRRRFSTSFPIAQRTAVA